MDNLQNSNNSEYQLCANQLDNRYSEEMQEKDNYQYVVIPYSIKENE